MIMISNIISLICIFDFLQKRLFYFQVIIVISNGIKSNILSSIYHIKAK